MNLDNDKQLCGRYPDIFRERSLTPFQSCMGRGIECGDGWYKLIDDLCAQLTVIKRYSGLEIVFLQAKEKLALLRIYWRIESYPIDATEAERDSWFNIVAALVADAENRSASVCEETGQYGVLHTNGGWLRILSVEKGKELGFITMEEREKQQEIKDNQ